MSMCDDEAARPVFEDKARRGDVILSLFESSRHRFAERIPAMRRRMVSVLVAQVIEQPDNEAFHSLLREEFERNMG